MGGLPQRSGTTAAHLNKGEHLQNCSKFSRCVSDTPPCIAHIRADWCALGLPCARRFQRILGPRKHAIARSCEIDAVVFNETETTRATRDLAACV